QHSVAGGGYADIWTGKLGDTTVAIKILRRFSSEGVKIRHDKLMRRAWREYLTWSSLSHPNIVQCLGYSYDFTPATIIDLPALISPWMSHGTLLSYIVSNPEINRIPLITGISGALVFLHGHHPLIVHGDIRAGNILVSGEGVPCLIDFGLSRFVDDMIRLTTSSNVGGSLRWMAPELLHNGKPNRQSDVWAFGMTILEILTGKLPYYQIKNDPVVIMKITRGKIPPRPELSAAPFLSDHIWDLCEQCWRLDPHERPLMRQIDLYMRNVATCLYPGS
ncbi:kinase-like domain-containing protein, partial [Hysterangium stoloniferum]